MRIIEMLTRFIHDDEGKHSYQIHNTVTGNVIWHCPDWYYTRAEAEQQSLAVRTRFAEEVKANLGLNAYVNEVGNPVVEYDPAKPIPGLGLPAMLDPNSKMSPEQAKSVVLLALAMHKMTGKYGVAALNGLGEVLIKPDKYVDTPEEAYKLAMENKDRYVSELKAMGYEGVQFMDVDKDSFGSFEAQKAQLADVPSEAMSDVRRQFQLEAAQENLRGLFKPSAANKSTVV